MSNFLTLSTLKETEHDEWRRRRGRRTSREKMMTGIWHRRKTSQGKEEISNKREKMKRETNRKGKRKETHRAKWMEKEEVIFIPLSVQVTVPSLMHVQHVHHLLRKKREGRKAEAQAKRKLTAL